jgi:plasmid stabilization system protein ParE
MTRLVVTADAEADTNDILTYLEEKAGPLVAARCGHRFLVTLQRVVEMPESGAPRPALGPNIRIAIVYPYLLI